METARQVFSRLTDGVVDFKSDANIAPLKQTFHAGKASQFSTKYEDLFELNNDFLPEKSLDFFGIGFEEEKEAEEPEEQPEEEEDQEMKEANEEDDDEEAEEEEEENQSPKKKGKKSSIETEEEINENYDENSIEMVKQDFTFVGAAGKSNEVSPQEISRLLTKAKHVALHKIFHGGIVPPVLIFVNSTNNARKLHKELAESGSLGSTGSVSSSSSTDTKNSKESRSLASIFDPSGKKISGNSISVDELSNRIEHIENITTDSQIDAIVSKIRLGEIWALILVDKMIEKLKLSFVSCVIHYDFPTTVDSYVKRTRFAAKTKNSKSFAFWNTADIEYLKKVMSVVKQSEISVKALESDERTKFLLKYA